MMVKSVRFEINLGRTMDPRFIVSALAGIFAVALIFGTITIVRQLQHPTNAVTVVRPG
jgi:hypothetical protein